MIRKKVRINVKMKMTKLVRSMKGSIKDETEGKAEHNAYGKYLKKDETTTDRR